MSDNEAHQEEQPQQEAQDKTPLTVYVGNMSWNTTEDGLRAAFESYGKITSIRLPRDHKDRPKGFGFVEFETAEEANKACEMDGKDLDGRTLKVNISQPKKADHSDYDRRGDRGDRRGGYGGRGDYGDRRGYDRGGDYRRGGDRRGYDRGNDRRGGY